jgi:putative ABC transport system permease protein
VISVLLGSGPVGRSVLGDLAEEYGDRAATDIRAARRWYRREALGVALRARSITRADTRPAARTDASPAAGDSMTRSIFQDVREAGRALRKQPRFLLIASLTLALGIGAVTAIFSVVNGVLLKPLPYPDAERLVTIASTAPGLGYDRFPISPDLFLFYQRHSTVFDDMALFQRRRANLTQTGAPEVVDTAVTTHRYFGTLGAAFSRGRPYGASDDRPDAARVAVMSHRLWTRKFGADESVPGRAVPIDGEPTVVVGVAPAWLDEAGSPDLWLPARLDPANPPTGNFSWNAIGRLKQGVRVDQAASNLDPLVRRAMEEFITSDNYRSFLKGGGYRPVVRAMKEDIVGNVREPLWILFGTVGMVLLVACGNVANLCLIRAEARQKEIAVRLALGASRGALVRKLLVEALVLSVIGCAIGVGVAALALPTLLRLAPSTIPRLAEVGLDPIVLGFAVAAAGVSALIFGLVPAIRYTRANVLAAIRQGGRGSTDHPGRHRGRNLLVVAQTAMALVLLVGSGLLARSFAKLMSTETGFNATNVLTFRVGLPASKYPQPGDAARFGQRLVDRLSEIAGVESAGAVTELPTSTPSGTAFDFRGRPAEPGRLPPLVQYQTVAGGYFTTLRIPLVRGRNFNASDLRDGVRTVIINQAVADQYWPGQDPIGKQLRQANGDPKAQRPWSTVVGVVASIRQSGLRESPRPVVYFPLIADDQNAPRALSYVLRGPQVAARADAVRQAVWSIDPELPLAAVQTLDEIVERSIVQFSFTMLTLAIAAGIALVLGAIGLYGLLSYAVSLRTREIGVRLALGAPASRVMRSVVASGAAIAGLGLVVGLLGAVVLTRFLSGLLYETPPLDLATFGAMTLLLFAVALVASYLPARRAASVSPLEAMREEV